MSYRFTADKVSPERQPDVTGSQATPVQNQWYTIFEKNNANVLRIANQIPTTGEAQEIKITTRDATLTGAATSTSSTIFPTVSNALTANTLLYGTTVGDINLASSYVKIELRKTSASGTQTLSWRVQWSKW